MKILIDANIALDVLLERSPFFVSGSQIFALANGGVELYISASSITDIYYIIRKEKRSKEIARTLLKNILLKVNVAAVSGSEIRRAIDLDWTDFEDAVQYATGESIVVDYLVTRNASDYKSASFPIVAPDELLKIIVGETG